MLVAIYSSGPKAGQLASTADAIRGYPGNREVALSELGIREKSMPTSLRTALLKQKNPTYPVEYRSPSIEIKKPTRINLASEQIVTPSRKPLIQTHSFNNFKGDNLQRLGELLVSGTRFDLLIVQKGSNRPHPYQGDAKVSRDADGVYLEINAKKVTYLKTVFTITVTKLD